MKVVRQDRVVFFGTLPAGAVFRRAVGLREDDAPIYLKFDAPHASKCGVADAVDLHYGHPTSFYERDRVVPLDAEFRVTVADVIPTRS